MHATYEALHATCEVMHALVKQQSSLGFVVGSGSWRKLYDADRTTAVQGNPESQE